MDVVIVAGLPNGKMITEYLVNDRDSRILKLYVLKDEYENKVSDFVKFDDIVDKETLCKINNINDHEEEIINMKSDIIFVIGWSQLISKKIIKSAKIGVIGFHPSKLPKDRGRSVLAWQIVDGYEDGYVSMFWIDEGVDSGNIIGQQHYTIEYTDTIRQVLDKVYCSCLDLVKKYYPLIVKGRVISIKQNDANATYRRKRTKIDGKIDWLKDSKSIYDLIRAISEPYPGAYTLLNGNEVLVLEAEEVIYNYDYLDNCNDAGTIIGYIPFVGIIVKCGINNILIKKVKIDNKYLVGKELVSYFQIGDKFGTVNLK